MGLQWLIAKISPGHQDLVKEQPLSESSTQLNASSSTSKPGNDGENAEEGLFDAEKTLDELMAQVKIQLDDDKLENGEMSKIKGSLDVAPLLDDSQIENLYAPLLQSMSFIKMAMQGMSHMWLRRRKPNPVASLVFDRCFMGSLRNRRKKSNKQENCYGSNSVGYFWK
ncbi:unnamed protein product, partial [Mesorhabditis belari]|uniref:Uncharacterized protein n=1 Tax=Mesorhabditis belari TaxID=2138241 RepID=A0AAF3EBT3_9BILA